MNYIYHIVSGVMYFIVSIWPTEQRFAPSVRDECILTRTDSGRNISTSCIGRLNENCPLLSSANVSLEAPQNYTALGVPTLTSKNVTDRQLELFTPGTTGFSNSTDTNHSHDCSPAYIHTGEQSHTGKQQFKTAPQSQVTSPNKSHFFFLPLSFTSRSNQTIKNMQSDWTELKKKKKKNPNKHNCKQQQPKKKKKKKKMATDLHPRVSKEERVL